MRLACTLLVVVAACQADNPDYPVIGGGGGGGGGSNLRPDGGLDPGDGDGGTGPTLSAQVCFIDDDLRDLSGCDLGKAADIQVSIGVRTAVTGDTGAFIIERPVGTNLVWRAIGGRNANVITPTVMPFSTSLLIPVVRDDLYKDLLSSNRLLFQEDLGAIVATIEQRGVRVRRARAVTNVVQVGPVLYDDDQNREEWDLTETGQNGVVWIPNLTAGTVRVTFTPPVELGSEVVSADVVVEEGAITFAAFEFP